MSHVTDMESDRRRAALEGKLVHLRLELALVMQELREAAGLTQAAVAERLNVQQPAIAKLERAGDHKLESIMRYLNEFNVDLLMAVKQGDTVVQVSDDADDLVVALPREVDEWAAQQGLDLDEFVMRAVQDAHAAKQHYRLDANDYRVLSNLRLEGTAPLIVCKLDGSEGFLGV